jgi:hypothetical protein
MPPSHLILLGTALLVHAGCHEHQRLRAILVLGALILYGSLDAGGDMCDTHGTLRGVYVLASRATGTVHI